MDPALRLRFLEASDAELSAESVLDFHKASGRGGQKVNKTSSAVRITHKPTGLTVLCSESRSQTENRHLAFRKLRFRIALECRSDVLPPPPDPAFLPSVHNDATYFPFLAVLLDYFLTCGSVPGVSASRLVRIFKRDEMLFRYLSEHSLLPSFLRKNT